MEPKYILSTLCVLLGLTLLWSSLAGRHPLKASSLLSAPEWHTASSNVIPGGTGLRHCNDALDPDDDLLTLNRLMIKPNPPVIGRNVSVTAFARFEADISANATTFFLVDADSAGLVVYGDKGFCNLTRIVQTNDGVTGLDCPPVEGSAFLRTDVLIDEYWPAGRWRVNIDARNGTHGDSARLFCVEGTIKARCRSTRVHSLLQNIWEALAAMLGWTRREE